VAQKIKQSFDTLDFINLQKFDLVSKAMVAATDFVHQLIKSSEITASVTIPASELFVNPRTSYYPDWVKGIIVISDEGVNFYSGGSKNIVSFEGRNVLVKSTTGTTFLKETIPTERAKRFILTLLSAARGMVESFEISPNDETELKQIIMTIVEMKNKLKKRVFSTKYACQINIDFVSISIRNPKRYTYDFVPKLEIIFNNSILE